MTTWENYPLLDRDWLETEPVGPSIKLRRAFQKTCHHLEWYEERTFSEQYVRRVCIHCGKFLEDWEPWGETLLT